MLDYSKMEIDPFCEGLIWEAYPKLKRRKEFCNLPIDGYEELELEDLNKMLRFVIVFIDPLSPLHTEKSFDYRIERALEELNYSPDEKFFKYVESLDKWYTGILMLYFGMVHNIRYEQWFTSKMSIHITHRQLLDPRLDADDRRMIGKELAARVKEVEDLEFRLFPDEYSRKIIAEEAVFSYNFAELYADPSD